MFLVLRQEDEEFKASLGYVMNADRPCQEASQQVFSPVLSAKAAKLKPNIKTARGSQAGSPAAEMKDYLLI